MNINPQIVLMAGVTAVFFGGVFLWLRHNVRKFDDKYGHTYTRPPET